MRGEKTMTRLSQRARLTLKLLAVLLAFLTAASAQVSKQELPRPKNASGCVRIDNTSYQNGFCSWPGGGCYYCEYSDPFGIFGCYEAPNPADGISCFPIYNQIPD
jgi:hypothetical protein